jgi:resolvase-like protein
VRHSGEATTSTPATGTRIGYTRVSTVAQTLDQQNAALAAAGVTKTFSDTMSGARDDRPGLAALTEYVREGDTVVVWKLDRLGRNTLHILETVKSLTDRGVRLISTTDGIDSSTAAGCSGCEDRQLCGSTPSGRCGSPRRGSTRPPRSLEGCPLRHRPGGFVIHWPSVVRTNSPSCIVMMILTTTGASAWARILAGLPGYSNLRCPHIQPWPLGTATPRIRHQSSGLQSALT